jgi:endonuclease/exonuclease/phosphatase family metal-dependent hydrolase
VILFATLTRFKPSPRSSLKADLPGIPTGPKGDTLTVITWNIGYGGLGREMDFFYEGGTQVRPSRADYNRYMAGITSVTGELMPFDLLLMQEVDYHSKRSYYEDQREEIKNKIEGLYYVEALNYDVRFVPLPLIHPMGRVTSGLLMAGRDRPESSWRVGFPDDESWPVNLFMLQRCFIVSHFSWNGKPLTVINTHNSAYDESGEAKSVQLNMLKDELLRAYGEGQYVVAGGDWNQNPPSFDPGQITNGDRVKEIRPLIPDTLLPEGWKWISDPSLPTNRDVNQPYTKGHTPTTIIDFFLVSPNIEVLEVKTIYNGFEFTDHHPVRMKIRLR